MLWIFFADAYGVENSHVGIRKMLHLVWMKGSLMKENQYLLISLIATNHCS